jgi:hypothetical protein
VGHLDQITKQTFAAEAHIITANCIHWRNPPEIPVSDLRPDGYLQVDKRDGLDRLPSPWCNAIDVDEILVELKLPGDHTDILQFERAHLRRQARQVQRLAKADSKTTPVKTDTALWFVAPNLPEWLEKKRTPRLVAPGCYSVEPSWFQGLWIAANELPLCEELVPFLMARSGRALYEFARWVAPRRPLHWVLDVLEYWPMNPAFNYEWKPHIIHRDDDPVLEAHRQATIRYLFENSPWLRREVEGQYLEKGLEKGLAPLVHQFERKLRRPLTQHERQALAQQLDLLGPERIGDLVLESTPEQLAVWFDLATVR